MSLVPFIHRPVLQRVYQRGQFSQPIIWHAGLEQ